MDSGLSYQALLNQSELQADHVLFTGLTVDQLIYATSGGSLASASTGSGLTFSAGTLSVNPSYIRGLISESDSNLTYNATTGVFDFSDTPVFTGLTVGALNGILKANAGVVSGSSTTSDLPEGSNLYYTDSRARSAISAGSGISYNSGTGVITNTIDDTDDLKEGSTNLFFTNSRARSALSAGSGISYNSGTGVISASAAGVSSATGTANQVLVNGTSGSAQTGAITLTLPQSIATTSSPTFAAITATGSANSQLNQGTFQNTNSGTAANNEIRVLNDASLGLRLGTTSSTYTGWTGDAYIYNSANRGINFGTNNTGGRMYLDNAGNLGVGITAPLARLHVQNDVNGDTNMRVRNINAGSSAFSSIYLGNNGGSVAAMFLNSSTRSTDGGVNTFTIRNDAGDLRLQSSGSSGMHITGGNVGIQRTPTATLDIARGTAGDGTLAIRGTTWTSQFNSGADEHIYLRAGKANARIYMQDHFTSPGPVQIGPHTGGVSVGVNIDPTMPFQLYNTNRGGQLGIGQQSDSTPYMNLGMDTSYVQYLANNAFWTGAAYNYVNTGGYSGRASRIAQASGEFHVDTASGGTNPISWNRRLTITNNGDFQVFGNYFKGAVQLMTMRSTASTGHPLATSITVNHSMPILPLFVNVFLRCTTTDANYAVGDQINITSNVHGPNSHCITTWFNSTQCGVRILSISNIRVQDKTTPTTTVVLNSARWQVDFYIYASV